MGEKTFANPWGLRRFGFEENLEEVLLHSEKQSLFLRQDITGKEVVVGVKGPV